MINRELLARMDAFIQNATTESILKDFERLGIELEDEDDSQIFGEEVSYVILDELVSLK